MTEAARFLCVHCDLSFAPEGDDERCPRCMRKAVPLPSSQPAAPSRGLRVVAVVSVIAVVAAGVAGYLAWLQLRPAQVGDTVANRPLEPRELLGHLERVGADRHVLAPFFDADSTVERTFAAATASGDDAAKTRAVAKALRDRIAHGDIVLADPRGRGNQPVRTPKQLAAALGGGARVEANSIELALLAVAALREADVPARVVEITAFEGEAAPPDGAGRLGYYAVGLVDARGNTVAEVASSRDRHPASGGVRVLDDLGALAAVDLARAGAAFGRDQDAQGALGMVEEALRLDPRSPSARGVRATLIAGLGDVNAAVAEARAALELRRDAPRLALVAGLLLGTGEGSEAETLAREALAATPDHGPSHAVLAALAYARRDLPTMRAELTEVERLDPGFERLDVLFALMHAAAGEPDLANRRLDAVVRARPREVAVRMDAAVVAAQAGLRARMIAELRAAVELTGGSERDALRRRIGETFGVAVLGELTGAGVEGVAGPDAGTGEPANGPAPSASSDGEGAPGNGRDPVEPPPEVPRLQLGGPGLGTAGRGPQRSLLGTSPQ